MREFRLRDGRTQEDLAQALGVTSQAVSRWEKGICYPDMELVPSVANFFGVSIDELFGYDNERSKKVDAVVARINEMNRANNGVDINMDECIGIAREALIEFPGNEKVMLCLASVLYNAGYVRYGEFHMIDESGYNVYDVERHRGYAEWKEAVKLYEKLLLTLEDGDMRHHAIKELTQLYLNTGEHEKALAIAETAPKLEGSREFLRINSCDGKKKAIACGEALLKTVDTCSDLMIGTMLSYEQNLTPAEKVQSIRAAIGIYDLVCTDGYYGRYNVNIARLYTLLSLYLWLDGQYDEVFVSLDKALEHAKKYEELCEKDSVCYSAPLVRLVKTEPCKMRTDYRLTESLADDWPWWSVQEYSLVRDAIREDPRWDAWVKRTRE